MKIALSWSGSDPPDFSPSWTCSSLWVHESLSSYCSISHACRQRCWLFDMPRLLKSLQRLASAWLQLGKVLSFSWMSLSTTFLSLPQKLLFRLGHCWKLKNVWYSPEWISFAEHLRWLPQKWVLLSHPVAPVLVCVCVCVCVCVLRESERCKHRESY